MPAQKGVLAIGAALALMGVPALAADMPVKAPRAPSPVFSWTGCYLGVNVGGGWGREDWSFTSDGSSAGSPHPDGWMAGGQVGCDYQFAGGWVIGIAAMYDWADLKDSVVDPQNTAVLSNAKVDSIGDVAGRLGYSVGRTLLYVSGGFAWARNHRNFTSGGVVIATTDERETKSGWVIGGGLEYLFAPNWSAKIEYKHFDFGTTSAFVGGIAPITTPQRIDSVLFGVNYRFGASGYRY
jgi:outer membrane immunogenic protein